MWLVRNCAYLVDALGFFVSFEFCFGFICSIAYYWSSTSVHQKLVWKSEWLIYFCLLFLCWWGIIHFEITLLGRSLDFSDSLRKQHRNNEVNVYSYWFIWVRFCDFWVHFLFLFAFWCVLHLFLYYWLCSFVTTKKTVVLAEQLAEWLCNVKRWMKADFYDFEVYVVRFLCFAISLIVRAV